MRQVWAKDPGLLRASSPYRLQVLSGSLPASVSSGTEACIRNAISYWAMRVRVSGSPRRWNCTRFISARESSMRRRTSVGTPSGLLMKSTGSSALRRLTPAYWPERKPALQRRGEMACSDLHAAAHLRGYAFGVVDEEHGVIRVAQAHAGILAGKEAGAPKAGGDGLYRSACGGAPPWVRLRGC